MFGFDNKIPQTTVNFGFENMVHPPNIPLDLWALEIASDIRRAEPSAGFVFEQKEPQALEAIHDDPEVTGLYRDYLLQYPKEEEFEVIATEHFTEAQLDFDYDVWYAVKADNTFRMLMGEDVPPRKAFIQAHARSVKNLDI